jgi:hypothetical protein
MRVQIDLGIREGVGKFLNTVRRAALGELMCVVLRVIVGYLHPSPEIENGIC